MRGNSTWLLTCPGWREREEFTGKLKMRNFHFEISLKTKKQHFWQTFLATIFFYAISSPGEKSWGQIPTGWSPALVCFCSDGSVGPSPDPGHLQPAVGLGHGPVSPKHPAATPGPPPGHHGALARDGHGLQHVGIPSFCQRGRLGAQTCPQLHQQGLPEPSWGAEE